MRNAACITFGVVGVAIVLVVRGWHLLARPELTEAQLMNAAWPWLIIAVVLMLGAFAVGSRA